MSQGSSLSVLGTSCPSATAPLVAQGGKCLSHSFCHNASLFPVFIMLHYINQPLIEGDRPRSRRREMPVSAAQAPIALLSSYLRGIGVFGSAAGRSLSFLMVPSTAFSPCVMYITAIINTLYGRYHVIVHIKPNISQNHTLRT